MIVLIKVRQRTSDVYTRQRAKGKAESGLIEARMRVREEEINYNYHYKYLLTVPHVT